MMPTASVTYTTPDGVERALRFTLGARKRIADSFGNPNLMEVLQRYGDGALPQVAYAMMYDEHGGPPAKLDPKTFAEQLDDGAPLLAAIMAAIGKGATPKNEIEALLRQVMQMQAGSQIGALSGLSPSAASDFLPLSSGTAPTESSTPSANSTETPSASPTTAPES